MHNFTLHCQCFQVDAKVEEAAGGVLFIDEAYSIVKSEKGSQSDSFGKEAIETIMKHLDPPSTVFIFAGYTEPMNDFLRVNDGLGRRIPFRVRTNTPSFDLVICVHGIGIDVYISLMSMPLS
jgi:SpoVK/Ycf46/Vps4 family AAA+-type ATPase